MKYLNEEEIRNELYDYVYNVNIKYATLLNGSWGSGKTYFIKKYIKELELEYQKNKENKNSKCKKPIYVSLYGLNNISEIKSKIALSLIKNEKVNSLRPTTHLKYVTWFHCAKAHFVSKLTQLF